MLRPKPMAGSSRARRRTVREKDRQFPDSRSTSDNSVFQLVSFCGRSEVGCHESDERLPSHGSFEHLDRSMTVQSRRCVVDRVPFSAPFARESLIHCRLYDLWAWSLRFSVCRCLEGGRHDLQVLPFRALVASLHSSALATTFACDNLTGLGLRQRSSNGRTSNLTLIATEPGNFLPTPLRNIASRPAFS